MSVIGLSRAALLRDAFLQRTAARRSADTLGRLAAGGLPSLAAGVAYSSQLWSVFDCRHSSTRFHPRQLAGRSRGEVEWPSTALASSVDMRVKSAKLGAFLDLPWTDVLFSRV